MFLLGLNDMRSAKIEYITRVARAETKQELLDLLARERVESYQDIGTNHRVHTTDFVAQAAGGVVIDKIPQYTWAKVYRKGGPLEWFNPPYESMMHEHIVEIPSREQYVAGAINAYQAELEYTEFLNTTPEASTLR